MMTSPNKFPDELVSNAKKKSFEFGEQYATAIWSKAQGAFNSDKTQIDTNRAYAAGTQDINNAKKKLMRKFIKEEHYLIDWDNRIKLMPQLLRNFYNSVDMTEFSPVVRAIDPAAMEIRANRKTEKLKLFYAKDFIQKNAEMAGGESPIPLESVPQSKEQIELEEQTAKPLRVERAEEKAIQLVTYESGFDIIQKQVLKDAVEINKMVTKITTDQIEGIKISYVDPKNFICSSLNGKPFHSDDNYFGEVADITIAQVMRIAKASGLQLSDKEIKKLAKLSEHDKIDESIKVRVLFYTFRTFFQDVFKKRTNRKTNITTIVDRSDDVGTPDEYNPKYASDKSQKIVDNYDVWFEGILCVDEGRVIKHELVKNMPEYKGKILPPYIVCTPRKVSFVEENIELLDSIQELRYRIIHHRNTLKGTLTEIDPDTLATLAFGDQKIDPKEALSLYFTQYLSFRKSRDEDGELINGQRGITEIPVGIPQSLIALMEQFVSEVQMLYQAFGSYQYESARPDPRTQGEMEAYRLSDNTAMRDYIDFLFHFSLINMQTVSARISDAFKWKNIREKFIDNIGMEDVDALEQYRKDRKDHSFILYLDYVPTKKEKALMEQNLSAYVAQGLLDPLDAMEIMSIKNIRTAMATMRLRLNEKQSQSQDFEMQKMRENQNINITTTQVANEEKRKTMELEYMLRGQEKTLEFERNAFLLQKEGEIKIQEVALRENNKKAVEEYRNNFTASLAKYKKEEDAKLRNQIQDKSAKNSEQLIKLRRGEISNIDQSEQNEFPNVDLTNL